MKYYEGVCEEDKPINGGAYIKENENGGECFNFQDFNGKCYGFVMLYGNMRLEAHFQGVRKTDDYVDDVLVIWVATNESNETRIVGWYKNATVYRVQQFQQSITNGEFDLYYNILADAKDCYLLPQSERTFEIQRAAHSGKGTGIGRSNVWYAESPFAENILIPSVIEYIDNYDGKYANNVYTDEILCQIINDNELSNDFQKIFDEGIKYLEQNKPLIALKFFNSARRIKETPEVLFNVGDCLLWLNCFDKAIPIYNKVIELEGNEVEVLKRLIECYDYSGNRNKMIECCDRLLFLLNNSKESIELAIYYNCVVFDIYILLRDQERAREVIDKVAAYTGDEAEECVKNLQLIIKEEFVNV